MGMTMSVKLSDITDAGHTVRTWQQFSPEGDESWGWFATILSREDGDDFTLYLGDAVADTGTCDCNAWGNGPEHCAWMLRHGIPFTVY